MEWPFWEKSGLKVFVKSLLLSALSRFLSLFVKLSIRAKIGHKAWVTGGMSLSVSAARPQGRGREEAVIILIAKIEHQPHAGRDYYYFYKVWFWARSSEYWLCYHSLPVCRPSHSDGFVLNYSCFELWIGVIKSQYYLISMIQCIWTDSQWNILSVKFEKFIGLLWHLLGHRDLLNIHSLQRDISIQIRSDQLESLTEPEWPIWGLITSQSSHHKNTEKAASTKQSQVCDVLVKIKFLWIFLFYANSRFQNAWHSEVHEPQQGVWQKWAEGEADPDPVPGHPGASHWEVSKQGTQTFAKKVLCLMGFLFLVTWFSGLSTFVICKLFLALNDP